MLFFSDRISVIFRVRSAKAVKITDASLIKKVGILCGFVSVALLIRTLVSPPDVIVGRTADNLKAFLCKTDWWDHTFTSRKHFSAVLSMLFFFIDFRCSTFSLAHFPFTTNVTWNHLVNFSYFFHNSRSSLPRMGRTIVYCGEKGSLGIQRESLHINGNLQRIPAHMLPKCIDVSINSHLVSYSIFKKWISSDVKALCYHSSRRYILCKL